MPCNTTSGLRELDLAAPVCHLSYYEADAFARWSGARLPSEAEWEHLASAIEVAGNLLPTTPAQLEHAALTTASCSYPIASTSGVDSSGLAQLFGDVWEWTASPYVAYPGYYPPPGAVGEYNGKFMCNQIILRGGSCVTRPITSGRATATSSLPRRAGNFAVSGSRESC